MKTNNIVPFTGNKVNITRYGLDISGELSNEEHILLWDSLTNAEQGIAFCIGDYLNHCDEIGRGYQEMLKQTEYDYKSLRNYKWLCKRIPLEQRTARLSFRFYSDALTEAKGDVPFAIQNLEIAEKKKYTVAEMRASIRDSFTVPANKPTPVIELESDEADKCFCSIVRNLQAVTTSLNKNKLTKAQYKVIADMLDEVKTKCKE